MKSNYLLVTVAALALAACNSSDQSEAPAADETAPAEAPAADAAAAADPASSPGKGDKPTREFVVGNWGNDGDCEMAMELKADGTSDGPFGNWAYENGVISFPETPGMLITVTVAEDGKSMDSVNAQGGKHKMTRC